MSPVGTSVEKIYRAMVGRGVSKGEAAATAQKRTGLALATGKPPKSKSKAKKKDSKKHEKSEPMSERTRERKRGID